MRGAISREGLWRFDGHAPETTQASLADAARFNEAAVLPEHARLPSGSVGGDVVLSTEVLADPRVRDLLRSSKREAEGLRQRVRFYLLTTPTSAS